MAKKKSATYKTGNKTKKSKRKSVTGSSKAALMPGSSARKAARKGKRESKRAQGLMATTQPGHYSAGQKLSKQALAKRYTKRLRAMKLVAQTRDLDIAKLAADV
jgi:hypothetical protein